MVVDAFLQQMKMKLSRGALGAAGALLLGGALLPSAAQATVILAFSQVGTGNTVTGTAYTTSPSPSGCEPCTVVSGTNVAVIVSALDAPGFTPVEAFLNFTPTSTDAAAIGADNNVRQNYSGSFTITSGASGGGTNYLSGSFVDLFEGLNASATLIASTPPDSQVTFTSDLISQSNLAPDRAAAFSFTNVTPGITGPNDGTIPSFVAGVSGNFSANSIPEPVSLTLLGVGLAGLGLARRKQR